MIGGSRIETIIYWLLYMPITRKQILKIRRILSVMEARLYSRISILQFHMIIESMILEARLKGNIKVNPAEDLSYEPETHCLILKFTDHNGLNKTAQYQL